MTTRGPTSFCLGVAFINDENKYTHLITICHTVDFTPGGMIHAAHDINNMYADTALGTALVDWLRQHVTRHRSV
jgi:hypothetical protein